MRRKHCPSASLLAIALLAAPGVLAQTIEYPELPKAAEAPAAATPRPAAPADAPVAPAPAPAPAPAVAPEAEPDPGLASRVDAYVSQYYGEGVFNGVVLAADRGKVVLAKGYGHANVEWQAPNAPDIKFPIASITKQFTAMLVLQDVAAGRLRLDATISDYLPGYPAETGRRITIRQLLNHTAGIPEYTWTGDLIEAQVPDRPEQFLKRFSHLPLVFQPGTSFAYSNSGYYVLGVILERVNGKPYEQLLHERILDPLGMKDSGYVHVEDVLPKSATGYLRVLTGRENPRYRYLDPARPGFRRDVTSYEKPVYRDMITLYAAGAMYSTVLDLYRWDRALAKGDMLPLELLAAYVKPGRGNYAFGWFVADLPLAQVRDFLDNFEGWRPKAGSAKTTQVQWHTGSVNGFTTSIVRIPERDLVVVLLNNTGMTRLADINAGIIGLIAGTPVPPLRHSVAERVAQTLLQQGPEAARRQFRELRDRRDGNYYVSLNEVNTLGQTLLRLKEPNAAVALLELGTETFPRSPKILDALAQAYATAGDNPAARNANQKLLALVQDRAVSNQDRDQYRRHATDRLARLPDANGTAHTTGGDSRRVGSPNG